MAKKSAYLVRRPRHPRIDIATGTYPQRTPALAHTKEAAANPHICWELCLTFTWRVFSRQLIKSVRQVVTAGVRLLPRDSNQKLKTT